MKHVGIVTWKHCNKRYLLVKTRPTVRRLFGDLIHARTDIQLHRSKEELGHIIENVSCFTLSNM